MNCDGAELNMLWAHVRCPLHGYRHPAVYMEPCWQRRNHQLRMALLALQNLRGLRQTRRTRLQRTHLPTPDCVVLEWRSLPSHPSREIFTVVILDGSFG